MSALSLRAHALSRAWRTAGRQPGVLLLALLLAALACLVLLVSLLAGPTVAINWKRVDSLRAAEATLFVAPGSSSAEVSALVARVRAVAPVTSAQVVSRDAALADLLKRRGGGAALPELAGNPLPDAIVLRFDAAATPAAVASALESLRKLPRVEVIQFDGAWHRQLAALLAAALALGTVIACAALLGIALALVAAVRLLTAADRDELRVMLLVGATTATIVRPYAYLGAGLLLLGSALATAILVATAHWLAPAMDPLLGPELGFLTTGPFWTACLAFAGAASLLGLGLGGLSGRSALRATMDQT